LNLVIGATGILGSHVVLKLLQNNQPVIAAKQKTSDLKKVKQLFSYYCKNADKLFEKIKWVQIDIQDIFSIEDALDGIKTVYNCSGFVSFDKKDKKKLFKINDTGAENIVNACIYKKIDALCHVSSIATINNSDYTLPLTETVFWKTSGKESDYAISKYNGEKQVWRGIEEGLNAVIVNPGIILSSGFRNQSSSKLFDACFKGNKFYTTGISGYIAAEDVASVMLHLINNRMFSNRYILIENNLSYKDIFGAIQENFHKHKPIIKAGKVLLKTAQIADALKCIVLKKPRQITQPLIHSALNTQTYSNAKIKGVFHEPFSPVYQVIKKICLDYLADNNLHTNP
jgi:nucleoside-diphosphate-sugar epimerase